MNVVLGAFVALLTLAAPALAVGFQQVVVPDPGDTSLEVAVWYPSNDAVSPQPIGPFFTQTVAIGGSVDGKALPLVVISHGAGASSFAHYDTALALAEAGFVVAAIQHTGDNYKDGSKFIQAAVDRPRHVNRTLDYMLGAWPGHDRLDPARVGVFGFSVGGFTALVAMGGVPDMAREGAFCAEHPDDWPCRMAKEHATGSSPSQRPASAWVHDDRIKAAVVVAPALGPTFTSAGLTNVRVPIQLWRGEDDPILRHPYFAQAIYDALPSKPEYHVVPKAGHFSFQVPCSDALARRAPDLCTDEPGFDRVGFHKTFNAAVVDFFGAHLPVQ
jgi:predicted dienelactone hydrolase